MSVQWLTTQDLKVDVSALPEVKVKSYLVLYTINIPVAYVHNKDLRRDVLERAQRLIDVDLPYSDVELEGNYILRNTKTGTTLSLTSPFSAFGLQSFDANTFVRTSFHILEHAEEKMGPWRELDTHYVFERLVSVSVRVFAHVTKNHPILDKRNLLFNNSMFNQNGRTFLLP
jgi:hypothetical protein